MVTTQQAFAIPTGGDPSPRDEDQRLVLNNVSWERYRALRKLLDDVPGLRMTYLEGTLEIMSPTNRHEDTKTLLARGPLPEPGRGRTSRRVKSFPITPRVTLRPDERGQRWLLGISSSDRSGLLYAIARVLARHQINLQLAKIATLGERVDDTFLIDGPELQHNRTQIEVETELLQALA